MPSSVNFSWGVAENSLVLLNNISATSLIQDDDASLITATLHLNRELLSPAQSLAAQTRTFLQSRITDE